jgi:hypothetical protein
LATFEDTSSAARDEAVSPESAFESDPVMLMALAPPQTVSA